MSLMTDPFNIEIEKLTDLNFDISCKLLNLTRQNKALKKIHHAAKNRILFWDNMSKLDINAQRLQGTPFDPRYKPLNEDGLLEAILKWESYDPQS